MRRYSLGGFRVHANGMISPTTGRRVPGLLQNSFRHRGRLYARMAAAKPCGVAQCTSEDDKPQPHTGITSQCSAPAHVIGLDEVGPEFAWPAQFYVVPAME